MFCQEKKIAMAPKKSQNIILHIWIMSVVYELGNVHKINLFWGGLWDSFLDLKYNKQYNKKCYAYKNKFCYLFFYHLLMKLNIYSMLNLIGLLILEWKIGFKQSLIWFYLFSKKTNTKKIGSKYGPCEVEVTLPYIVIHADTSVWP